MTTSAAERDAEAWVRETFLPKRYKASFERKKAKLSPGGKLEFAAVSDDGTIVAHITTASYRAGGAMQKVRADAFYLLMADAPRKLLVFTESDMHDAWQKEQVSGRLPPDIQLVRAELTPALRRRLDASMREST
jgi:hypothetical protein